MSNVEGFSALFSHSRCSREGICTGRILDWLEKTPVSCNLTTCLRVERQKHLQVPRVATLAEGAAKLFLPLLFKVALMMSVHLKSQSLLIGVNPAVLWQISLADQFCVTIFHQVPPLSYQLVSLQIMISHQIFYLALLLLLFNDYQPLPFLFFTSWSFIWILSRVH